MASRLRIAIGAFLGAFRNQSVSRRVPSKFSTRMYAASKNSRLTADWLPQNSSADTELHSSLTQLRGRSRQLIRDTGYAKRARILVVNNVVGCGIVLQAKVLNSRDKLNERVNADIEEAWEEWAEAENCHTGGRLDFSSFERLCMGQVFEAGEIFIRKHYRPFGPMGVPLALEVIEAERIADDISAPNIALPVVGQGNQIRMGIEVDEFKKPVAYWIRQIHPGELRFNGDPSINKIERVPADQIIHLAVIDRWPQTRGEPWLHAVAPRLNDMDGYSEAEIVRARSEANLSGAIETTEESDSFGDEQTDGSFEMESEPGIFKRLNPGEKLTLPSRTSPNSAMDPFMRLLLREVSAGAGPSYESISRDYSQSNYSASRLALLDDRDLWKVHQSWFVCRLRYAIHKEWLRAAVLSGKIPSITVESYALNTRKFEAARFKCRGWSWIDPQKEVDAYTKAVRAGFMTNEDVITLTNDNADLEDLLNARRRELNLMKAKDLHFTTDAEEFNDKGAEQPSEVVAQTGQDTSGNGNSDSANSDGSDSQDNSGDDSNRAFDLRFERRKKWANRR